VRDVDSHGRPDNGLGYLVYDNSRKTTLPYQDKRVSMFN
jgi:hypothetical protein